MEYTQFGDLALSKLMLGTVQFGLNYGVANKLGQPSYETSRDIIRCAYEGGVRCLDTAAIYGTSEEVIGRALDELGIAGDMVVVTKVTHIAPGIPATLADKIVDESVSTSLKRLKIDSIPICMMHAEENAEYLESLLKLKDSGMVQYAGISVNTPDSTRQIIESGFAEALQVPINILDRRFTGSGVTKLATNRKIAMFVRSIYLQGLVLSDDKSVSADLVEVIPILGRLRALANEAGICIAELAMRYILGLEGMTCVLVGVDSVEQMRQNLELIEKGPLRADLMAAIADAVPNLPDRIVMPGKWSKRMADVKPRSI